MFFNIFSGFMYNRDLKKDSIKEESYFFDFFIFYFMLYNSKKKVEERMDINIINYVIF